MNIWRLRRMLFRPVGAAVAACVLLTCASSYFYLQVKVWMYGPESVLLVGVSGRALCVQRCDYQPAIARHLWYNSVFGRTDPPPVFWPSSRFVSAGWLGRGVAWKGSWKPELERRESGWVFSIPWWYLAITGLAFLAILQAVQSRRFCRFCGYDLAGLPTPICPECGRPFRPAQTRAT